MNNEQKSITWINLLKAFCIIGVYFIHCQFYYGCWFTKINLFVQTFYVNAFFFISGYLVFWKQLSPPSILEDKESYMRTGGGKKLALNVLFRVIIPSVLFSTVEFLPSSFLQGRGIGLSYALYKTVGGGTYWFTSALVVAELVLLLLFSTRRTNIWFYASICFALGFIGLLIVKMGILKSGIWAWRQGLISLFFLAMGGVYWRYEKQIDKLANWWFITSLVIVYAVMVIFLSEYNDPVISTLTIQPLGVATSATACLLLVWFCKTLPIIKPLVFIGRNSLGFYFMSGALPISLCLFVHKVIATNSVWMMLIIWIVCMVLAYLAVKVINRWLPWLWDFRLIKQNS